MPTQKIDPKVIFASDAPAIDKPPVFSDKTKGMDVTRINDGRPEIKEFNKLFQDIDLKILWLNENAVTPYDETIDYPDGAVTLKDGSLKQKDGEDWNEFLDTSNFASKDAVKRGIANRYDSSLTYNSGERVVLTNGDIVKSTIDGNTNDPNVNMTGWVKINSASQIFDASGESQQWVNDKKTLKTFYDFGAKCDGITDDTISVRLAVIYSDLYGTEIQQNTGVILINTFDQNLSDGIKCAVPISGNLKLSGSVKFFSPTSTVANSIFGIDSRANNKNIKINGVGFGGGSRYRAIHSTGDATLDSIDFSCVHTELQSVALTSAYKKSIKVNNNKLGTAIDATTPITPFMEINIPLDSPHIPSYEVCRNSLWGGTETRTGTSYGFKNIPVGGKCDDNFLCNIGKSETEGFDIDGLGSFASFSGNVAIYSGFEYKPLATGFYSRDAIFNNNISYESFGAAFSLRSSINANGNIAYNPSQFGLFMGIGGDPSGYVLNHGVADVSGFKIIWAGSTLLNAVRVENAFKRIVFDKLEITIDPTYATSNPTAKLSATGSGLITIIGDVNHVQFNDLLIGKSAVDQVNIRATTKAGTVIFNNPSFGDSDASCIDAQNVNNLVIHNPIFGNAVDRAVRISSCDNVDIISREYPFLANVLTTATNTNALVNGFGIQAVGVNGAPTNPYRIGAIVQNSFDDSIWLKQSATWVKVGPNTDEYVILDSYKPSYSTTKLSSRFSSLAAAQAVYPSARDLNDYVDLTVLQQAINDANGRKIVIKSGVDLYLNTVGASPEGHAGDYCLLASNPVEILTLGSKKARFIVPPNAHGLIGLSDDITVRNIHFYATSAPNSDIGHMIKFSGCKRPKVYDCEFTNVADVAVNFGYHYTNASAGMDAAIAAGTIDTFNIFQFGCSDFEYVGNKVNDCYGDGGLEVQASVRGKITRNDHRNCRFHAYRIVGCKDTDIHNNHGADIGTASTFSAMLSLFSGALTRNGNMAWMYNEDLRVHGNTGENVKDAVHIGLGSLNCSVFDNEIGAWNRGLYVFHSTTTCRYGLKDSQIYRNKFRSAKGKPLPYGVHLAVGVGASKPLQGALLDNVGITDNDFDFFTKAIYTESQTSDHKIVKSKIRNRYFTAGSTSVGSSATGTTLDYVEDTDLSGGSNNIANGTELVVTNPSGINKYGKRDELKFTRSGDTLVMQSRADLKTGQLVTLRITSGSSLPAPLAINTPYYVIVVDTKTVKLAISLADALSGTAIPLTSDTVLHNFMTFI